MRFVSFEQGGRIGIAVAVGGGWRGLLEGEAGHPGDLLSLIRAGDAASPPRPSRSAIFLPRRCATALGLVCSPSASNVARIMLYGLDVPVDLVTTSATPSDSKMARIGPPAMMPVPEGAERT